MPAINLLQQRTRELHLRNDIQKPGKLELKSNFNFNVKFAPDGRRCVATLYQSFEDKGGDESFSLSVTLEGVFDCMGVVTDSDRREIHLLAYDALFPYLQATVSQLFAGAGMPGFMVKKMKLDQTRVTLSQPKPPTLPIV